MSLFDADELLRIAAHIDDHAAALRGKAHALSSAAAAARWHSPAATTFRQRAEHVDRRIIHCAHNLERAAHELRAHAGRVRTAEAVIAGAARAERLAAKEALHLARDGVSIVAHVATDTERTVRHATGWLEGHL